MGGGASKSSHNSNTDSGECSSQQDSNLQQQQQHYRELRQNFEAKESAGHQDDEGSHASSQQSVIPKRSPRAQLKVQLRNNHNEEGEEDEEEDYDGISYSPHSSRDHHDDDLDYHHNHTHEDEDEGGEDQDEEADTEEARQLRVLFAQSAMSMDMDNEDLIFNLLYFGGDTSNFASMMNNAAEETVAAHSAGNTPYKLTPATALALQKLRVMTVTESLISDLNLQECSICQEELEVDNVIAEMPGCSHCFHNECVLKWFELQSWCPVCRTKILPEEDEEHDDAADDEEYHSTAMTKANTNMNTHSSEDITTTATVAGTDHGVKSNLGALFDEAADKREEDVY